MINNPTKQEVIETLIAVRDRIIKENSESPLDYKEKWYIPDCLAYAINFMEGREDDE